MVEFHQPAHHLVERALIGHVKLLGIVRTLLLRVAADRGARRAADLRHAEIQHLAAHGFALARGNDDARVGHGDAHAGDDLGKELVGEAVVEHVGVDVVGVFDARNADGVRADAVNGFEVLRVHHQAREFILIALQPEQNAQPHVVDAAVHGAVHRLGVVVVIVLRPRGVKLQVAFLVVGLLKEDISADARVFQLAIVFDRGRGDIHVHAADVAVFVVNGIDGFDAI